MINRARAMVTGLAALAALVLVVAGLPVVLYRFGGSPLPGQIAGWHRIAAVLVSRDDGSLLVGVIRACSWLAWLLFTACVLTEAQAAIRGRYPPHLRLGGLQGTAAYLVALVALGFAAPSAITLSASAAAIAQPGSASHPGPASDAGSPMSGYLGAPEAPQADLDAYGAVASRLVVVRAGDCLWSLAERYLGAGDRYPEIASLNYGHEMGDGQVFTSASFIEPGWQLLVPGTAAAGPVHADGSGGVHLGHSTADAHYRRRHPAASTRVARGRPTSAHGAAAPEARTASRTAAPDPGTAGSAPVRAGAAANQLGFRTSASVDPGGARLPDAAVFVTGALAGAVLTSLGRLRHRQRQERRRGRRIALPADPEVLATEQRLRAATTYAVPVETLRDALACLQSGILGAGQELPDIVALHVTPDLLEVLLNAPAADAPPAPYSISPGRQGMCWQLDLPAIVTAQGAAGPAALPCDLLSGLITAGATETGYLLLDLEAVQVMGCDGPSALVDQVVATIATELATGQWSGWYDLVLVGCDEFEVLGRAEHCATLDEALDRLEARCAAVAHRLAARAPADVRELRLAEPDNEDWGLAILVSRVEPAPEQMTRMLKLVEDGYGGFAALVAGDPETADGRMAPTVLQLAPDPHVPAGIVANVIPLQITVRPRALSASDYDAISSLLAVATSLDDVGADDEPYLGYAAPPWIPQAASLQTRPGAESADWANDDDDSGLAPWPAAHPADGADLPGYRTEWPRPVPSQALEVKILGPFTITGSAEPLQPKQAELVLALALAVPAGLSNSALCTMLGADPDHPKPTDAVRQIITRTRRRLGLASDGQEYIIHAGNGQYVLHPEASLDWSLFRGQVALGRADDLRAAISLISGQPFTGSYFWWIDIPLIETVRAELVDAAETLAEFELTSGSPRAAAKAARAGLMAEASAEQLWRAVMRAEHAAGNLAGVTEAWRRCLDAIEDIAPDGEPHPDTVALYRQLTTTARQHVPAH